MRDLTILLCIFTLMFLYSAAHAVELDTDKFMPVDEIKPGMKGVGKTVFEGAKIEEFQVEVLEVVKNAVGPKGDIIWVLCSGGPLEETGVLSGMSGSPVYIDGRLIGALAYRLGSFAKRPLAGVTPIADMLAMFEKEEKTGSTGHSDLDEWPFPESASGSALDISNQHSRTSETFVQNSFSSFLKKSLSKNFAQAFSKGLMEFKKVIA